MPVLISVVSRWFYKKRGLALGIATSGSGLGALVVAPFAAYLISSFDWRISYIVLGVFACLVVISLALLLRRDPAEIGALPDGVKSDVGRAQVLEKQEIHDLPGFSLSGAFKTSSFWLMLAVWLLFAFCLTLIMTHVVAYATDIGISTIEASTVLGVMGGVNILTRLLMGPASDVVGRKIPGVFCAVIGAVALVWLIYSHNLWMFYLFAVVFGVSWGGIGVTLASMVGDIFGGRSLGTIMGVLETGFAMGSAIGPAVGGFVFDVTGNYTLAFAAAAAIMLIAGVLISLTKHETKV